MPYAAATDVSIDRSKHQLEAMLRQRGCEGFASAWSALGDTVEFLWKGRRIRFTLPKVDRKAHSHDRQGRPRAQGVVDKHVAQADRARWRVLFLVVKAKLEAVEAGVSIFEEEFLAFIVNPADDRTVGQVLVPMIQAGGRLMLPASE